MAVLSGLVQGVLWREAIDLMRGKAGGVKMGRVAQVFDVGKLALKFGKMPLCMYVCIYIYNNY